MSNSKTILDVLLETNRVTDTEAANFSKNLSNQEIEDKLRVENIVTSQDIAKAYAVLFDLPVIRLLNYNINPEVLTLIPKPLAEKYQIIAFEQEGGIAGGKIKLALGKPSQLKDHPPEIISEIREKKNVQVDFFITTTEDIKSALNLYDQIVPASVSHQPSPPSPELKPGSSPMNQDKVAVFNPAPSHLRTVDLSKIQIPYEVISKFPIEISKKYNMIVFDNPLPNLIKVAAADPYDKKVTEILDFVKQKNEIQIDEYKAAPAEIAESIKLYYRKPEPPKATEPQARIVPVVPQPAKVAPAPLPTPPPPAKMRPQVQPQVQPQNQPLNNKTGVNQPVFVKRPEQTPPGQANIQTQAQAQAAKLAAPTDLSAAADTDLDRFLGQEVNSVETLQTIAQSGNVPQILAGAIALAVAKKASDIHIEPEEKELRIRFRIDGILNDVIKMPLELQPALISRIKILSRLKIDELRIPQDGRLDAKTHGHEIDVRVSTLPTVRGEKAALRILDKTQNIYGLEELGFSGRNLKVIEENITKPFGVILATGPTGSGKSTTLYSILKKISSPNVNVITLEDPVEYEMPGINQCQVKPKIGFSFAEGLRSVLRQDPNIIMVGEIRDAETAGMATHAALTGHLVLSTLHTNDAAGALPRLINMGIEPFLITSSVNVIIAQRLVRKICPKCKKEAKIPEALMAQITEELKGFKLPGPYKFYEGAGCPECNHGFSGRMGIYEVLAMSNKIEELAIKRRPASEIFMAAVTEGMTTMKQDGLLKALKGVTTISEVLRVTTSG